MTAKRLAAVAIWTPEPFFSSVESAREMKGHTRGLCRDMQQLLVQRDCRLSFQGSPVFLCSATAGRFFLNKIQAVIMEAAVIQFGRVK